MEPFELHQIPPTWWERFLNRLCRLLGRPARQRRYAIRFEPPLVIPPGETRSIRLRIPSTDKPDNE